MNTKTAEIQDISADDALGEEQIVTEKELEKQFLHPGYTFKGKTLKPYTAGTDLLFNQVLDQNDAPYTVFLSFIFIHTKNRNELIELCWDKQKFREAFLDWLDGMGPITNEDKSEAMRLFEDMRGWARKSSVEVLPDPDRPEKKNEEGDAPTSIAWLIEIFADKFTRNEILWEIPLVQLNQLKHVHLHRNGASCRRRGTIDVLDRQLDALSEKYASGGYFD